MKAARLGIIRRSGGGCFRRKVFGPVREWRFPNGHSGAPEQVIVDRALSTSFIAALSPAEQERIAAEVRELIATSADSRRQKRSHFSL